MSGNGALGFSRSFDGFRPIWDSTASEEKTGTRRTLTYQEKTGTRRTLTYRVEKNNHGIVGFRIHTILYDECTEVFPGGETFCPKVPVSFPESGPDIKARHTPGHAVACIYRFLKLDQDVPHSRPHFTPPDNSSCRSRISSLTPFTRMTPDRFSR